MNDERRVTVLISSHNLNELYLLASDYIMIHKGKIIDSLSHSELVAKCRKYVRIKTNFLPQCVAVIEKELDIYDYTVVDDNTVRAYAFTDEPEKISQILMEHGVVIRELSVSEQNIEEYFLAVTGGGDNE